MSSLADAVDGLQEDGTYVYAHPSGGLIVGSLTEEQYNNLHNQPEGWDDVLYQRPGTWAGEAAGIHTQEQWLEAVKALDNARISKGIKKRSLINISALSVLSSLGEELHCPRIDDDGSWSQPFAEAVKPANKIGRNQPCPCGSGKKYKKCHNGKPIEPPK